MDIQQEDKEKLANFYVELIELEDGINSLEYDINFTEEQLKQWGEGQAALTLVPIETDWQKVYSRFLVVAKACQKWQAGPQPLSDELFEKLENLSSSEKEEFANSLVSTTGNKNKWVKQLGISRELMEFIALNTIRPALKEYAGKVLTRLPLKEWEKGYCPVCGEQPAMAKLSGKEGVRKLFCGTCETEWRFKRIGCPFCGENTSPSMSFLTMEDNKQYRVYLCDHCKSYLKTVDERVCGEVDLFCEDLATADLDKLATNEGYRRGDTKNLV